ncbi:MAG: AraC family transcriptional regulator ligand-binding domain-containing protein [Sandaracinaceae bacterium]
MARALQVAASLEHRVGLALRGAGIDPRTVGLDLGEWPPHDRRVPAARLEATIARAHASLPDLALRMAMTARPDTLNPASALLVAAPTLREGLRASLVHWSFWTSEPVVRFDEDEGALRFVRPASIELGIGMAVLTEHSFAEGLIGMRAVTGTAMRPRALTLEHGPELSSPGITTLFGVLPRHHAEHASMRLADEDLDRPLITSNPLLFEYIRGQVDDLRRRLPVAPTCREEVCLALEHDPSLTLTDVAARLARSARALQRTLASEGTSFAALSDEVKQRFATEAIEAGQPIERIAAELGFSDARALRRAFLRWTGATPSEWRRRR